MKNELEEKLDIANQKIKSLKEWVNDLQSGMYINCVYCGHRYGPKDKVPCSMADALKEHIEKCPEHPMSKLKQEFEEYKIKVKPILEALNKEGILT